MANALASKTCFPVALLVGRQSRRLQGPWLQNDFGLLRRPAKRRAVLALVRGAVRSIAGLGLARYFPIDNTFHVYDTAGHVGAGAAAFGTYVSNANNVVVTFMSRAVGGEVFASLNDPAVWALRLVDAQNTWGERKLFRIEAAGQIAAKMIEP
jgi:hypothetical protein